MNRCSLFLGDIQIVCGINDRDALLEMGWTKEPSTPRPKLGVQIDDCKVLQESCSDDSPTIVETFILGIEDKESLKEFCENKDIFIDYRGSLETVKAKAVEAWKQRQQS